MAGETSASTPGTEFSTAAAPAGADEAAAPGIGPYRLAARRLRRNKLALAFGALFLLIVILCLLAPRDGQDRRQAHRCGFGPGNSDRAHLALALPPGR